MGFDIQMVDKPTPAEIRQANLDAESPGYFRFRQSAMPVMVLTMVWAGAMVEEEAPTFPQWPPATAPEDRAELIDAALRDPKGDAKLTPAERATTVVMRTAFRVLRTAHSTHAGKVPSFKFRWNDGFIVNADECVIIAARLRAYAKDLTSARLGELDAAYRKAQQPLIDAAKADGEIIVRGDEGLGMTLDDYRAWILAWAAYNEVAAHHHGYEID